MCIEVFVLFWSEPGLKLMQGTPTQQDKDKKRPIIRDQERPTVVRSPWRDTSKVHPARHATRHVCWTCSLPIRKINKHTLWHMNVIWDEGNDNSVHHSVSERTQHMPSDGIPTNPDARVSNRPMFYSPYASAYFWRVWVGFRRMMRPALMGCHHQCWVLGTLGFINYSSGQGGYRKKLLLQIHSGQFCPVQTMSRTPVGTHGFHTLNNCESV